jgi:hypothetical protein
MVIQDESDPLVKPLELAGRMLHFKHQLPTTKEVNSLKQYCLTLRITHGSLRNFLIKLRTNFINRWLMRTKSAV